MIEKVEGIVLKERSYSETSKILDVYTKEYGIIGILSKGCKRMKSPLRSTSSKLTYGYFHIHYKKDKLSTLTEVDVINSFKNIKSDITKISYASYLLELAYNVENNISDIEIYNLLINTLEKIEEGLDPLILTYILELKYLNFLGIMPVIDGCAICGSPNIVTISSNKGGFICKNCLNGEEIVSNKTIKLIRLFYYVDISKISKIDIKPKEIKEIGEFLDSYYDTYSGLYLKSKKFIQELNMLK